MCVYAYIPICVYIHMYMRVCCVYAHIYNDTHMNNSIVIARGKGVGGGESGQRGDKWGQT